MKKTNVSHAFSILFSVLLIVISAYWTFLLYDWFWGDRILIKSLERLIDDSEWIMIYISSQAVASFICGLILLICLIRNKHSGAVNSISTMLYINALVVSVFTVLMHLSSEGTISIVLTGIIILTLIVFAISSNVFRHKNTVALIIIALIYVLIMSYRFHYDMMAYYNSVQNPDFDISAVKGKLLIQEVLNTAYQLIYTLSVVVTVLYYKNCHIYGVTNNKEIEKINETNNATNTNQFVESADTIKKYKELFDIGAITQEEFDKKKHELLEL